MKILVTGGAGFIGSNFIFHMREKHPAYELVCLDKLTYAGNLETLASVMDEPNFKFIRGDIADRGAVYGIFETEKPDVVHREPGGVPGDQCDGDPGAAGRVPEVRRRKVSPGIYG